MIWRLWFYRISRLDNLNKRFYIPKFHSTMNNSVKRGALLVFEGLDRCGKSTQSRLLVESLKKMGKDAELVVFPDRSTPIGKIIGEYLSNKTYDLNDQALHLLFTANRFENVNKMKKLLLSGVSVIVDRYSFSGIVFSSAKKGMDVEWCKCPESGLPAPDAVYFLVLPVEDMKKRPGFGEERYESIFFQTKVLKEYLKLAEEYNFTRIDANDSIENIHNAILQHTLKVIDTVGNTDLRYLDFISERKEAYEKENINMNLLIK